MRQFWEMVARAQARPPNEGLAAAHAAGLVHRDFKPSNVIVGLDGRARVVDFGFARPDPEAQIRPSSGSGVWKSTRNAGHSEEADFPVDEPQCPTMSDQLAGTPAYMAPEHIGKEVTAASDQFASCVALWEALFQERPHTCRNHKELARAKVLGQRRPGRWASTSSTSATTPTATTPRPSCRY